MSTAAITKISVAEQIERVVVGGDLSTLKPEERVSYYRMVCDSLGLNPLTKPFDYIQLNGKLTLYAKRDATDQLRKIHAVSILNIDSKNVNDVFIVTAHAKDRDGREDTSTGAVAIANLKGDALANALMKAETKAKRRVTLSICGLGLLDETEIETIPQNSLNEAVSRQGAAGAGESGHASPTARKDDGQRNTDRSPSESPANSGIPRANLNGIGHGKVEQVITTDKDGKQLVTSKGSAYVKVIQEGQTLYCYDNRKMGEKATETLFNLLVIEAPGNFCDFVLEEQKGKIGNSRYFVITSATRIGDREWLADGTPVLRRD